MVQGSTLFKNIGIGLAVVTLVPVVVSTLAPVLRPAVRYMVKAGVKTYERSRESIEEMGESFEDIVAEAHEEMIEANKVEHVVAALKKEATDQN